MSGPVELGTLDWWLAIVAGCVVGAIAGALIVLILAVIGRVLWALLFQWWWRP